MKERKKKKEKKKKKKVIEDDRIYMQHWKMEMHNNTSKQAFHKSFI